MKDQVDQFNNYLFKHPSIINVNYHKGYTWNNEKHELIKALADRLHSNDSYDYLILLHEHNGRYNLADLEDFKCDLTDSFNFLTKHPKINSVQFSGEGNSYCFLTIVQEPNTNYFKLRPCYLKSLRLDKNHTYEFKFNKSGNA